MRIQPTTDPAVGHVGLYDMVHFARMKMYASLKNVLCQSCVWIWTAYVQLARLPHAWLISLVLLTTLTIAALTPLNCTRDCVGNSAHAASLRLPCAEHRRASTDAQHLDTSELPPATPFQQLCHHTLSYAAPLLSTTALLGLVLVSLLALPYARVWRQISVQPLAPPPQLS